MIVVVGFDLPPADVPHFSWRWGRVPQHKNLRPLFYEDMQRLPTILFPNYSYFLCTYHVHSDI